MKSIFLNASPNKEGITTKWAAKVMEGLEYETLHLVDYQIHQLGQSSEHDEFKQVIETIAHADLLVIGTPIYWWDVTGLLKTFIDRLTDLFQQDISSPEAPLYQVPVLWIVQGSTPKEAISGIKNMLEKVSDRFYMENFGVLYQKSEIKPMNMQLKKSYS